ncbi:MAG: aldehyde ferredoxin oxidoreductase family protein [Deltaproteobacteria bacterium]|nr:aldehyde ferredoxin oxidoreductase family protein [Deltaproteobacteria bacterium]
MKGYAGKLLRVNLSDGKVSKEEISDEMKRNFLGGRGFALKLLWDEVRNVDPLSERNKIVFSTGPLTGQPLPSSGKMVIASKSPLTGGYGDGNIGTMASIHLRKAGYDVAAVEGKSDKPCYLLIEDEKVKIVEAPELWGKNAFEAQDILEKKHGKRTGVLVIGPGGENKVRFATVMSQKGRAAGRPGMGAVMGSKNLKAVVIKGSGEIPTADNSNRLKEIGKKGYAEIKSKENYDFWIGQGTMQAFDWCNENACLPTYNFREGIFEHSKELDGYMLQKIKVDRKGCPMCNMQCGNIVRDSSTELSELDYENVALLGPNIGMKDLRQVALLNRMADEWGLDTISLGSCIAFLMEASEKGLISEAIEWGDFEAAQKLIGDIGRGEGLGKIVSNGVRTASETIGKGSHRWAMQVKGLEISGYNCHACPGMALSFGTSPIGAHHKDAWVIAWEISTDRFSYNKEKVEKVIELQRIRGGFFESATVCRFPWVEVNLDFNWYPDYVEAITGNRLNLEDLYKIGDRIYSLMRAYWVRENQGFNRQWDYPPDRWFEEPLPHGELKGAKLDREKYDQMLSWYYELRGWDENGVPLKETLDALGLTEVSKELMP